MRVYLYTFFNWRNNAEKHLKFSGITSAVYFEINASPFSFAHKRWNVYISIDWKLLKRLYVSMAFSELFNSLNINQLKLVLYALSTLSPINIYTAFENKWNKTK